MRKFDTETTPTKPEKVAPNERGTTRTEAQMASRRLKRHAKKEKMTVRAYVEKARTGAFDEAERLAAGAWLAHKKLG